MHLPDPTFPPMFKGHAVKAPLMADAEACRRAAAGELGAGDLVWSRNTARAECALILEPEVPLTRCCQMAALGFVAIAETLGHTCPPRVAVEVRWPGIILVNGAVAGSVRLMAPKTTAGEAPAWLVLATSLTLRRDARSGEPGAEPGVTALDEEGGAEVTRTDIIEALATRLLAWLHTWGDEGFRKIHDHWLYRAEGRDVDVTVDGRRGRVVGLDEDGNLMLRVNGRVEQVPYLPHIVTV